MSLIQYIKRIEAKQRHSGLLQSADLLLKQPLQKFYETSWLYGAKFKESVI